MIEYSLYSYIDLCRRRLKDFVSGGTIIGENNNKLKKNKNSKESDDSEEEDSDYDVEEFSKMKAKAKINGIKEKEKDGFEIVQKDYGMYFLMFIRNIFHCMMFYNTK